MKKFLLIDANNLFHRSRWVVGGDTWTKIGMSIHIMFHSMLKLSTRFENATVVFCVDSKSWRKEIYQNYKIARKLTQASKSNSEIQEDTDFYMAFDDVCDYIKTKTNVVYLRCDGIEADDFISLWIQRHSKDEHVIVSSDSDFFQLVSDKVSIYNGITQETISPSGFFDDSGKQIVNKKTNIFKSIDPEWELFKKCMKGDSSDSIWPAAAPRTRETAIQKAFEDRHQKGYIWTNFVMQEWTDHDGITDTVLNRYNRNKLLIDLTQQPKEIIQLVDGIIQESVNKETKSNIGFNYLKLCEKYQLQKMSQNTKIPELLNRGYDAQ